MEESYFVGPPEFLSSQANIDAPVAGAILAPSLGGIELFLWAFNHGDHSVTGLLSSDVPFVTQEGLRSVAGARKIEDIRRDRNSRLAREREAMPEASG